MFKIVTIPFNRNIKGFDDDLLNQSFMNKHVQSYRAEFFADGEEKYWTVFAEYDSVLEQKPYKKEDHGLDESQNVLLDKLREWRKIRAEKEGVPVYLLGTNKELADIVKTAPKSSEALGTVKGFGKGKIEKYGKEIIEIISAFYSSDSHSEKAVNRPAEKSKSEGLQLL